MSYIDYEFYQNVYFGNLISVEDFPRLAERASERVNDLTFKRLRKWLPEDEEDLKDIKKAVCCFAESIYYDDTLSNSGMAAVGQITQEDGTVRGKVISSVSAGNESIGYATGGSSANSLEGMAIQKKQQELQRTAMGLLSGIQYKDYSYTILFAGVGYE